MNKYDEELSNTNEYVKIPFPVNAVKWTSGEVKMASLLETDPALYLGGWNSQVEKRATKENPAIAYPVLPFRVVEREGKEETYKVYSTCVLRYQHIATRTRYELRKRDEKGEIVKNEWGFPVVLATTKNFVPKSGYTPVKEILALVADKTGQVSVPIYIPISGWGMWKSHNKAEKAFQGIVAPEGKMVLRCVGTKGKKGDDGKIRPIIETINSHDYNPIDALNLDSVMFADITPEFENLWEVAQAWKNCKAWNAEKGNNTNPLPPMPDEVVYEDIEKNPFDN